MSEEPKLRFISFLPERTNEFPIEKASVRHYEWFDKLSKDHTRWKQLLELENKNTDFPHTIRCPGIIQVSSMGWVQRAYQNITVNTFGREYEPRFSYETNPAYDEHGWHMSDVMSIHGRAQLTDIHEFKRDTHPDIFKLSSPWLVVIPKGYTLLISPIPYNDDNRFTACFGALQGMHFLNVLFYWHVLRGSEVIRRGTPLTQMILVKDDESNVPVSVEDISTFEKDKLFEEWRSSKPTRWRNMCPDSWDDPNKKAPVVE